MSMTERVATVADKDTDRPVHRDVILLAPTAKAASFTVRWLIVYGEVNDFWTKTNIMCSPTGATACTRRRWLRSYTYNNNLQCICIY